METLKVLLDISPQSWIVLWMQELCLLVFISPLLNTVSGIVKWGESHSVVSDSLPPYGLYSRGLLQARVLEWVAFLFSRGSSNPGIEPRSSALQVDLFPDEPQGKPKNTGVVAYPFFRDLSDPGIDLGSPALQMDSLPPELSEKPCLGYDGFWNVL